MFCCAIFRSGVEEPGKKGLSFVASREEEFRYFCLQARAFDYEDEDKIKNIPWSVEIPRLWRLVHQWGIQYCPFCGASLEEVISKNVAEFDKLVDRHDRFLLK